jgi:hypothetical protein
MLYNPVDLLFELIASIIVLSGVYVRMAQELPVSVRYIPLLYAPHHETSVPSLVYRYPIIPSTM